MNDPAPTPNDPSPPPPSPAALSEEVLQRAYGAFKKRLKLTKLDQESKLGGMRPTTSGKKATDLAIRPPNEFPREVWQELASRGRIKDCGGGFYTM